MTANWLLTTSEHVIVNQLRFQKNDFLCEQLKKNGLCSISKDLWTQYICTYEHLKLY